MQHNLIHYFERPLQNVLHPPNQTEWNQGYLLCDSLRLLLDIYIHSLLYDRIFPFLRGGDAPELILSLPTQQRLNELWSTSYRCCFCCNRGKLHVCFQFFKVLSMAAFLARPPIYEDLRMRHNVYVIDTRIKNIKNVTRCKDTRSAKSIETRYG